MGSSPPRQLPLPLRLDDEATFANFLVTQSNQQLLAHLAADGEAINRFIWLWGSEGSGRTHLLQALCHQSTGSHLRALYIPLKSYQAFEPGILEGLDETDLVCLDDVEQVVGMPEWETALFRLYNQLAEGGSRLVIAARQAPARLHWQLADLDSRMQQGLVFPLNALSDEEKLQALQLRARARGFELPADVGRYLLLRHARDMGSLFAVLHRLDELSLEKQRRITVPLLRELLSSAESRPDACAPD